MAEAVPDVALRLVEEIKQFGYRPLKSAKLIADRFVRAKGQKGLRDAWFAVNRAKAAAAHADWRRKNPDKAKAQSRLRAERIRAGGGKPSEGIREKLFMAQRGKCACCKEPLGDNYHLDHIMPLALGGTNADDNLQLLRAECNAKKGAKHPDQFMSARLALCEKKVKDQANAEKKFAALAKWKSEDPDGYRSHREQRLRRFHRKSP